MNYVQTFIDAYIECALWSSTDNTDDSGGSPLDNNYGPEDLAPEALAEMKRECLDFVWHNRHDLARSELDAEQAGHDFWLTRNGHGTGFWDRGLGQLGDKLTRASKPYGTCDIYVGDNGTLYI